MLTILGYVVKDSEDRYLTNAHGSGFMYKRTNQETPYIFSTEGIAETHAKVFNASGATVTPVYIHI